MGMNWLWDAFGAMIGIIPAIFVTGVLGFLGMIFGV